MSIYERLYQTLKSKGDPAWTGAGYERAWHYLTATIQTLQQADIIPAPGSTCLELGCGNGAMVSLLLARQGYLVDGVDISPTAITWAQEKFSAEGLIGRFQQGDVCVLDNDASQQFMVVYDGSCIHCLIGEQRPRCFSQIKRVLKSDGIFIVSSMCGEPKRPQDRENYDAEHYQLRKEGQPWRTLMPLPLLRKELAEHGFEVFHESVNDNPWWNHATLCCRILDKT